jgi:Mrp family chromosome partitioning ATPase
LGKVFEYYSTIHKRDVEWLWYPYIACGKITILQGDPGEGKSTVAIRLSALLSTAGILPDGTRIGNPVNIIYQCSADGLADTIKPRLEMAGADCDRMVHIIEDNECLTLEDKRMILETLSGSL